MSKAARQRELRRIRQLLQRRRRGILETSRGTRRELGALKGQERDPEYEENAQSELADYTLYHLVESQRLELQLIDIALKRLDNGTLGQCLDCGIEIPFERLQALPFAMRCAEDAALRERAALGSASVASL